LEAIKAPPMMADYKLVEWRYPDLERTKESVLQKLEEFSSNRAEYPYTMLVLVPTAEGFDTLGLPKKQSKLYKRLSKSFEIVDFPKSSDAQILSWLARHFDARGVKYNRQSLEKLLERAGNNMQTLKGEVDKLCAYVLAKGLVGIDNDMILEIVSPMPESDAFALSNAILNMNVEQALFALNDMKYRRVDPAVIFANLASVYSDLTSVAMMLESGTDIKEIETIMKMHQYKLSLYINSAKRYGAKRLSKIISALGEADGKSKSGGIAGYLAIELFVMQSIT
jgi:DNA polymerase-3 subunit delta